VTAAVVVVYGIYRVAERLVSATEGTGPDVNENLRRGTATAGDAQVPAPGP
jgi:hypothetical protein